MTGDAGVRAVGFVGLGNMGGPMAANLLRSGVPLVVCDVREEATAKLVALGAVRAGSPAEVAAAASVVHVNVLTGPQTEQVLFDRDRGVIAGATPGTVAVVHSTIDLPSCARLALGAREHGMRLVDAPTTGGGSAAAARGDLTMLVGGEAADLDLLDPTFRAMASTVLRVGRFGSAQLAKLVNNLVAVVNSIVLEEALDLADAAGLGSDRALEVLGVGTGAGFVAAHRADLAAMARAGTNGVRGQVEMSLKDLLAVLGAGREHGIGLPMAALATQYVDRLFTAESAAQRPDAARPVEPGRSHDR